MVTAWARDSPGGGGRRRGAQVRDALEGRALLRPEWVRGL